MKDYPFYYHLWLFRDPYALKDLEYPRLIVKDSPLISLDLDLVLSMTERKSLLKKKVPQNKKVFLNSQYNDSIAHLNWEINLQYVSETHIKFSSPLPIPNLTVLSLNLLPKLYVTVVEKKNIQEYSSEENEYIGIIHGPGKR